MAADTLLYPWRIEQGERERLVIPIIDADGISVDITDWTIDAQIKTRPGGDTLYVWPAELVSNIGTSVSLVIPGTVSVAWKFRSGWWRLVITDPTTVDPLYQVSERVIAGPFVVDAD